MIKNRISQLIFRMIFLTLSFVGIIHTFGLFYGDTPNLDTLVWYTTLSNLLCFVVMLLVVIDDVKQLNKGKLQGYSNKYVSLKFYTTIGILITFLVFNIILADKHNMFFTGWNSVGNLTFHILCPLLFVIDWFIFSKPKTIRVFDPLVSTILPLMYVVVILIRGQILYGTGFKGTIYPYFFLNVAKIGFGNACLWVLGLFVFFVVCGYLLWLYNNKVEYNKSKKINKN